MIYSVLPFKAMPFNRNIHFNWGGYFIGLGGNVSGWIRKLSKFNYNEIFYVSINYNVCSDFEDCRYFYHTSNNKIKKLIINTFEVIDIDGYLFPKYKWETLVCYHNLLTKRYEVLDSNDDLKFEYKFEYPIVTKFITSGILIFQNDLKENNWISSLDPNGGKEKWRIEFPWQFVRLETYKNLIVLEYQAYDNIRTGKGCEGERDWYNPNRYTIVINGDTGKEVWRYPNSYSHIDYEHGVVLIGNINSRFLNRRIESLSVVELDIIKGDILTNIELRSDIEEPINFHFVDSHGIYYTAHDGSFGKISKTDGSILWEFDLLDNKGEKRKLSDWLLLGNGKLVLQTMPNHPNGDFSCIFNPKENLEYSKVKDGIRIPPPHA